MKFNPQPKPEKVEKKKKRYVWKRKATGEMQIFDSIWSERPHYSQSSGELIYAANPGNFMHVLAKGLNKYPKFKGNKQNIVLVTEEEHYAFDFARHEIKDDPKWQWVFELEASLKEQYKLL